MEKILSIRNITKSFGDKTVISNLSLDIEKGRFITLLGPSGCGKTTTIRMIAGLEAPDCGNILLNGQDVTALPPDKRSVNTVFQNYALFPHLNVYKNIAYGLKVLKYSKDEIRKKVQDILSLVELPGFELRMPGELSGGQRQRVAIARALVLNPDILLLDEPLGALDLQLRRQMQRELKAMQTRLGITFIYITHDQEEAMAMSDEIVIMQDGQIVQQGTPREIYEHPATPFAASFIGESNIIDGELTEKLTEFSIFMTAAGQGIVASPDAAYEKKEIRVSVRPADLNLSDTKHDWFDLSGTVKSVLYTGSVTRVTVDTSVGPLTAELSGHSADSCQAGDAVYLWWDPMHSAVIGGYGEAAL